MDPPQLGVTGAHLRGGFGETEVQTCMHISVLFVFDVCRAVRTPNQVL